MFFAHEGVPQINVAVLLRLVRAVIAVSRLRHELVRHSVKLLPGVEVVVSMKNSGYPALHE